MTLLLGRAIVGCAAGLGCAVIAAAPAHALSSGCAGIAVLNANGMVTLTFDKGDVISATITGGGGAQFLTDSPLGTPTAIIATGGTSGSFTVPVSGPRQIEMFLNGGVGNVTCKGASSGVGTGAVIKHTNDMFTRQAMNLLNGMTTDQMRKFIYGQRRPGQTAEIEADGDERTGVAAAGEESRWAVWGNVGYTRFGDRAAASNTDGQLFMSVGGVDYRIGDRILVGGAASVEGGWAETKFNRGSLSQSGVGVTPYAAVKITDVFSATALGTYTRLFGASRRDNGAGGEVRGEYELDRWGLSIAGDGNWTWGKWGLLGTLTTTYAQTQAHSFRESDGTAVGSTLSRLGTISVGAQPGYLFEIDRAKRQFVEPYVRLNYEYDYTMTKTPGAPNDPDGLRFALGTNLAFGTLSGNVEARTVLLREKQWDAGILGTVRYNF